jgi:hypothetical protein
MPVEIKELHIKATVGKPAGTASNSNELSEAEKEKLIQECLERMFKALKLQTSR